MGIFGGGSKAPKSKLLWGPNQKDVFRDLFGPGGPIRALMGGAPSVQFMAGVNRSQQMLNSNMAGQGMFGQPVHARANKDLAVQAAVGSEANALQTLLGAANPASSGSSGGGGGNTLSGLFGM